MNGVCMMKPTAEDDTVYIDHPHEWIKIWWEDGAAEVHRYREETGPGGEVKHEQHSHVVIGDAELFTFARMLKAGHCAFSIGNNMGGNVAAIRKDGHVLLTSKATKDSMIENTVQVPRNLVEWVAARLHYLSPPISHARERATADPKGQFQMSRDGSTVGECLAQNGAGVADGQACPVYSNEDSCGPHCRDWATSLGPVDVGPKPDPMELQDLACAFRAQGFEAYCRAYGIAFRVPMAVDLLDLVQRHRNLIRYLQQINTIIGVQPRAAVKPDKATSLLQSQIVRLREELAATTAELATVTMERNRLQHTCRLFQQPPAVDAARKNEDALSARRLSDALKDMGFWAEVDGYDRVVMLRGDAQDVIDHLIKQESKTATLNTEVARLCRAGLEAHGDGRPGGTLDTGKLARDGEDGSP
jgi:hypothetical protein